MCESTVTSSFNRVAPGIEGRKEKNMEALLFDCFNRVAPGIEGRPRNVDVRTFPRVSTGSPRELRAGRNGRKSAGQGQVSTGSPRELRAG